MITNPKRLCLGLSSGRCASANFHVKRVNYDNICGQAKAFHKGSPDAFNIQLSSIDGNYVDGISITLGSPRKHVWTYAVGLSDEIMTINAVTVHVPLTLVPVLQPL